MTDLSPAPVQGTRYTGAELRALIAATESAIDAASSAGSEGINTVAQLEAAIASGKPISVIKPEWWGAVADSDGYSAGTDNLAAFGDMFAWMKANPLFTWAGAQSSYQVELGHGNYYFSDVLLCRDAKTFVMVGRGAGWRSSAPSTKLLFAAGCKGLVFDRGNTLDDAVDDVNDGKGNDGSHIRDFMVESLDNGTGTDGGFHGIQARCQIFGTNITVRGFRGHGIYIVANGTVADMPYRGSANCWMLTNVSCSENKGDGVHVFGQDSNQGMMLAGDCTGNGGWGIYANSFLGCKYLAVHTSGNAGGCYKDANASSHFDFCYSEGNQPAAENVFATSGMQGAGIDGQSIYLYREAGDLRANGGFNAYNAQSGTLCTHQFGSNNYEAQIVSTIAGAALPFTMRFYGLGGAGNENSVAFGYGFGTPAAILQGPNATFGNPGGFNFTQIALGSGLSGPIYTSGSAAPTTGAQRAGNVVLNDSPSAGGTLGWVCTANGTPGTWKPFGIIEAVQSAASSATYAAPSGGGTQDTECRASLVQLAADLADLRSKIKAAKLMA